jgi:tetratricopeptide (TPR) repeat protein
VTAALRSFRRRRLSSSEGHTQADRVLSTPRSERLAKARELHLDDPELLLCLLGSLAKRSDSAPAAVLEEAEFFYGYLEGLEVRYPTDPILCDEQEYFLGEAARIAGTAARILSKREEARNWFDLSEAWFLTTENASANIARLSYQRLALRIEERDFPGVLRLVPHLIANFERLAMPEDAIKARFLLAVVLKESGRLEDSVPVFDEIVDRSRAIHNDTLLAWASMNLAQTYAMLQDPEKAMAAAEEATPLLRSQGNHVGLGKLQMAVGLLLRSKRSFAEAIEAFRYAQREFSEIALHADVAAVHLIVADLLLEVDQPAQAEWEIRAALPIIDEYKLVPEGIAALSLLRDSIRRRQIDRNALRGLHGYFAEIAS